MTLQKSFSNNIKQIFRSPARSRTFFVMVGFITEILLLLYPIQILHKSPQEFAFPFLISIFFWTTLLFVREVIPFLIFITISLIPYNRFLIIYDHNAYLLGRVSDYILISVHFFEVALWGTSAVILAKYMRRYAENVRRLFRRETFSAGLVLFTFLLLLSIITSVQLDDYLTGFTRIQILIDAILFLIILREISFSAIKNAVISAGIIQVLIGVGQVSLNHSIGLYGVGESKFNEGLFYIAKTMMFGRLNVRAYGTFPHPNLFAMFIALVIIFTVHSLLLRYKGMQCSKDLPRQVSTKVNVGILSILLIGIYLSQSRAVILGLVVGMIFVLFLTLMRNLKRVYTIGITGISVALIGILAFIMFDERINSLLTYDKTTIANRLALQNVALDAIRTSPFFGLGPNGYLVYLAENRGLLTRLALLIEPVHNVFLLTWTELGIFGFLTLIVGLIFLSIRALKRSRGVEDFLIVIPVISLLFFTMNLDHYLITLKQGGMMLGLALAVLQGYYKVYR